MQPFINLWPGIDSFTLFSEKKVPAKGFDPASQVLLRGKTLFMEFFENFTNSESQVLAWYAIYYLCLVTFF